MNGEIISLNNCSVFRARHNNQPVGQCLRSFEGKMKIFPRFPVSDLSGANHPAQAGDLQYGWNRHAIGAAADRFNPI
ncbi:hypothetical protein CYQ92_10340 [Escherichia coli]|nr:hypothetical protein CYQ92_10340 [Escherichia coli]